MLKVKNFIRVANANECWSSIYVSDDIETKGVCDYLRDNEKCFSHDSNRVRNIITIGSKKYFLKVNALKHRNERIRTTLKIKRRGTYDWSLAEIDNGIRLSHLDYIPAVKAYGFKRNRIGLVTHTFILTEYIDKASSALELIKRFPERMDQIIFACFDIIYKHLGDGFIHLDLWLGNIMLSECLNRCWMIDLEYCKIKSQGEFDEKLGFCLGYFHRHTLSEMISLDDYQNLFNEWCERKSITDLSNDIHSKIMKYSTLNTDRKIRFEIF